MYIMDVYFDYYCIHNCTLVPLHNFFASFFAKIVKSLSLSLSTSVSSLRLEATVDIRPKAVEILAPQGNFFWETTVRCTVMAKMHSLEFSLVFFLASQRVPKHHVFTGSSFKTHLEDLVTI